MKFLLVKPGHFGDALLLTPTIRLLRERFPDALIDVAVRRGAHAVLEGNPDLSRLFLLPAPVRERLGFGAQVQDFAQLFFSVAARRYDYAFDFTNSDRARLWLLLAAARKRCAHNGYGELKGRALFYNVQSKMLWGQEHQVLKDSRLVTGALNLTVEPGPLVIDTHVDGQRLRELYPFLQSGGNCAVIHPTSRWAFKQWLPERWAAVADWLAESRHWEIVFTCGPDAREKAYLNTILDKAGRRHAVVRGESSLRELAWIIQQARLFCGVDTVAMHLAAAVGKPTVALFGPTSEWSWRPWKTDHELVLGPCTCKQTRQFVCDKSKPYPCMQAIAVAHVIEAIERLSGENRGGTVRETRHCK